MVSSQRGRSFKRDGEHSLSINRYLLNKAKKAKEDGLDPIAADFSWRLFLDSNPELVEAIARDHPAPASSNDRTLRVRQNFKKQVIHFTSWLQTGDSYPVDFARKVGLIDSGLGGTSTASPQVPGNDDPEPEDQRQTDPDLGNTFAEEEHKEEESPPQPSPPEPSRSNQNFDNFCNEFENKCALATDESDEMRVKVLQIDDIRVKDDVVGNRDLLVCQVVCPPGAVLSTFKIQPDETHPFTVHATVDIDPNVSNGLNRCKRGWWRGNRALADLIQASLTTSCKQDVVEGTHHERVSTEFEWPNRSESELNPLDPFRLWFRDNRTLPGKSLFETHHVPVKGIEGKVVPIYVVTAFFLVAKARHDVWQQYDDLEITESEDSQGGDPNPKQSKKRKGGSRPPRSNVVDDEDGDEDMGDAPGGAGKESPHRQHHGGAPGGGGFGVGATAAGIGLMGMTAFAVAQANGLFP